MAATRMLSPEDIYDVYGIDWVLQAPSIEREDKQFIEFRLAEIKSFYVNACKVRLRAEAKFLGADVDIDMTVEQMLSSVRKKLEKQFSNPQTAFMGGANLMGTILKAHQTAGTDLKGINLAKFGIGAPQPKQAPPDVHAGWFDGNGEQNAHGRIVNDPKWAEIARAYQDVESARTPTQIVAAIDKLNDLQHNSFHVLIDLQTGRMLNDYNNATSHEDARKRVIEILDMKKNARSPVQFAGMMSKDVQKLLVKYRQATIQIVDE